MEEKRISEKESLEIITAMIARTKDRYIGNGNIMLLWGYLTVAVSLAVWILLAVTLNGAWNRLWFLIPAIGLTVTPFMDRKHQRDNGVKTFSDVVTSRLWAIAGGSEIVVTIVCLIIRYLTGANCWSAMFVYTLIAMPIAEIAQGLIIKEKSLTAGGAVGLAVGIVTVCCVAGHISLVASWYMPLFILAFVAMMIVPGHILNSKSKQQ